ncbi:uncharacterized protein TNCV_4255671 [Trichonephila clavipes]|nr:uncharacterized protein TNCV_4255671 [Trichonephila clavipes]
MSSLATRESRFNLSSDGNHVRVWKPRGEHRNPVFALQRHTTPTADVTAWDVIAYNIRSHLVLIRGTMTAQRVSQECLLTVTTLLWPDRYPDLSPIEHIWDHLGRRVGYPPCLSELEAILQQIWNEMSQEIIQNLYASMPDRMASCICARGGSTGWGDSRLLSNNFDKPWASTLHPTSASPYHERNVMSFFKKYKYLKISKKQKVIESVEKDEKKVVVAKAFDILLRSLFTVLKNKDKIVRVSFSRERKCVSKDDFPRLEQYLVKLTRQLRGQNTLVGDFLLKEKSKAFAKELGIDFSASEGWLTNFKKGNGIIFKKMCGESLDLDINVCSKWQNSLSDLIKKYNPRNIFNTVYAIKILTFQEEK